MTTITNGSGTFDISINAEQITKLMKQFELNPITRPWLDDTAKPDARKFKTRHIWGLPVIESPYVPEDRWYVVQDPFNKRAPSSVVLATSTVDKMGQRYSDEALDKIAKTFANTTWSWIHRTQEEIKAPILDYVDTQIAEADLVPDIHITLEWLINEGGYSFEAATWILEHEPSEVAFYDPALPIREGRAVYLDYSRDAFLSGSGNVGYLDWPFAGFENHRVVYPLTEDFRGATIKDYKWDTGYGFHSDSVSIRFNLATKENKMGCCDSDDYYGSACDGPDLSDPNQRQRIDAHRDSEADLTRLMMRQWDGAWEANEEAKRHDDKAEHIEFNAKAALKEAERQYERTMAVAAAAREEGRICREEADRFTRKARRIQIQLQKPLGVQGAATTDPLAQ